jgi:hypothetical protein
MVAPHHYFRQAKCSEYHFKIVLNLLLMPEVYHPGSMVVKVAVNVSAKEIIVIQTDFT